MTDEQKKLIAEWMGWEIMEEYPINSGITWFQRDKNDPMQNIHIKNFNPHNNDTQFIEVLKHMTGKEMDDVQDKIGSLLPKWLHAKISRLSLSDTIWVMEHKQEVLDALEEVIKNG